MRSLAIVASLCVLLGAGRSMSAWQGSDYVVGGQDVVTVTVFDHPNLSGKFTVETDGAFTFPLIGRVKAGGMTPRAIEDEIGTRLRAGYIKNPQISVSVDQYRSQRIFVIGAVAQPGTYVLTGNTTLIEALSRAGSTTSDAVGEAMIVRARPGREVAGPVLPENAPDAEVVRVDLRQLESGSLTQNVRMADGDTIVVPRGEQVFLLGEVRSPGSYAVGKGTSVLQLLALGGGVTERGATGRIKIVRSVAGKKSETKVKLDDIVQPGDTVVVPEKYF
jgi:polysaccharide export outer membrane protein